MTRDELTKLIDNRRLTWKLALELSIKKWKELDQWWKELSGTQYSYHFPSGGNCALCRKAFHPYRRCKGCPLIDDGHSGCEDDSTYMDAIRAIRSCNRPAFRAARAKLLVRMSKALARLEKKRSKR